MFYLLLHKQTNDDQRGTNAWQSNEKHSVNDQFTKKKIEKIQLNMKRLAKQKRGTRLWERYCFKIRLGLGICRMLYHCAQNINKTHWAMKQNNNNNGSPIFN